MWNNEKIIAVGGSGALLLDSDGRVQQTLTTESLLCNANGAAISASQICVSLLDKAKLVFLSSNQTFRASVPEVVTSIAFSKSGEILYAGGKSGRLLIWQTRTGALLHSGQIFYTAITGLDVDSSSLLLSSASGDLHLINLVELFMNKGDQGMITGVTIDMNLGVAEKKESGTNYVGHSAHVVGVLNLLHGPLENDVSFVSVSRDKNLRLWHHTKQNSIKSIFIDHTPMSLSKSICGGKCFIPCEDGVVVIVDLKNLKVSELTGHIGPVSGCVESRNLVTCALDGIRIWNINSKICLSHHQTCTGISKLFICDGIPRNPNKPSPLKTTNTGDNCDSYIGISLNI
ncbi:hypothetical protein BEWA_003180 [Theileria equi strain WA]|uniref:Uncharacterized protein n=1 Tax=Theileria equi strain WA TaxID=1537102 RepID=L0AZD7_THEEQ|nr:hypothetical protein BEWA_003180 [Theileria equi strain WA]AFZ80910.1 hypothetical protein BEWA_003180 [Theileria equi strain WA]|eukprot:XP_004830576.1 hypothetical protein BEWA_003180 [Theileria equi strain WA]